MTRKSMSECARGRKGRALTFFGALEPRGKVHIIYRLRIWLLKWSDSRARAFSSVKCGRGHVARRGIPQQSRRAHQRGCKSSARSERRARALHRQQLSRRARETTFACCSVVGARARDASDGTARRNRTAAAPRRVPTLCMDATRRRALSAVQQTGALVAGRASCT